MVAVALALAASAAWGVADFVGGLKSRALPLLGVLAVTQASGLVLAVVLVAAHGEGPPAARFALWATLAGLASVVGLGALYRALALGPMGVVSPVSATGPVVPVAVGLARGDRPSTIQITGIGLAVVGVVLAGREPGADRGRWLSAGAVLALVSALGLGSSLLALDAGSDYDPYWTILVLRTVSAAAIGAAVVGVRPSLAGVGPAAPVLVVVGLLDIGAAALAAVATTRGLISVVAVLVSLYPIVVVFLARLVLHERLAPLQRAGAATALAGAALISAG